MCSGRNLYVKNGLGGEGKIFDVYSGRNLYVEKWTWRTWQRADT